MIPSVTISGPKARGSAPLLVLGPSLGTSRELWLSTATVLEQHYRVVTWDLPGHGNSPVARSPFTVRELALAVFSAVSNLGEESFHYAGVSLGGAVGLEMMLADPERVASATIVCSGAKIGTAEGWKERAAAVRRHGTSSLVAASAGRWFAPGTTERSPEMTSRLLSTLRDTDDDSYALCADALAAYDVRSQLGNVAAPVLALWGEHDQVTPQQSAVEIAQGVVNGRSVRVAGASHLAPADRPDVVTSLLRAHLRSS